MLPALASCNHNGIGARLRLVLAAFMLLLALAAGACSGGAEGTAGTDKGRQSPPPSPLFYEIARDDGPAQGWMLGTIHALPPGTAWRTPAITAAAKRADRLLVEVAALGDTRASAAVFSELAITPGLPPLAARVAAEHREAAARLADQAGLPLAQQQRTESWAAALMLARVHATGDPAYGADRALLADFAGRPVRELEGLRGQLSLFDTLPEADQRLLLSEVVAASTQGPREAEALRAAWLAGDAAALEAASRRGIMAAPALREALLVRRNQRWLALIEADLAAAGRPLIAVGAAHLVGPEGLIALLEARGWRITRLT